MDKREQILRAALKLFNHNGFDKTPTAMISKEAGVATGTLFHYFAAKEDLINSVYLFCKDSMVTRLMADIPEQMGWWEQFGLLYRNFLKWGMECPEEISFFRQYSNSPHIREKTRQEGMGRFAVLLDFLRKGIKMNILKPLEPEYMVLLISGMMMAGLEYWSARDGGEPDEAFIRDSFAAICDAVAL